VGGAALLAPQSPIGPGRWAGDADVVGGGSDGRLQLAVSLCLPKPTQLTTS
jgi:hypothetical protein